MKITSHQIVQIREDIEAGLGFEDISVRRNIPVDSVRAEINELRKSGDLVHIIKTRFKWQAIAR